MSYKGTVLSVTLKCLQLRGPGLRQLLYHCGWVLLREGTLLILLILIKGFRCSSWKAAQWLQHLLCKRMDLNLESPNAGRCQVCVTASLGRGK